MAQLVGQGPAAFHADTTTIDTAQKIPLGTVAKDKNGNEYVYLQGCASTAAGDVVTYTAAYLCVRTLAAQVGPAAVAMAAVVANQYGWYQIYGYSTTVLSATANINAQMYLTGTASAVSSTYVAGDQIHGMVSKTSSTGAAAAVTVWLNRPWVNAHSDS